MQNKITWKTCTLIIIYVFPGYHNFLFCFLFAVYLKKKKNMCFFACYRAVRFAPSRNRKCCNLAVALSKCTSSRCQRSCLCYLCNPHNRIERAHRRQHCQHSVQIHTKQFSLHAVHWAKWQNKIFLSHLTQFPTWAACRDHFFLSKPCFDRNLNLFGIEVVNPYGAGNPVRYFHGDLLELITSYRKMSWVNFSLSLFLSLCISS